MKVLIFPSSTFEALSYANQLKSEGHCVIGAASVVSEFEDNTIFDELIHLPHIIEEKFIDVFAANLLENGITHFWTSVNSVYFVTKCVLQEMGIDILCCDPMLSPLIPVKLVSTQTDSRNLYIDLLKNTLGNEAICTHILKSTIFNVLSVPGQSHFDKLITICQIFSDIPKDGDLIEIGSLWGRSAMLFAILSQYFGKGNLLCIDPWPSDGVIQNTENKLDSFSKNLDVSICFTSFVMKLASLFPRRINYIKDYSDNALPIFTKMNNELTTVEFGCVRYEQKIALLHIDGNHGLEAVRSDVDKWCPHVIPGGWIIFDDYNWNYGKGPSTVVDEYLRQNFLKLETAFFCGGAMFVKHKLSLIET
jgi:hypothetical protein